MADKYCDCLTWVLGLLGVYGVRLRLLGYDECILVAYTHW